jgi:hypothetical protein
MPTESMDMDQLQAKLQETSNIAWAALLALNAGASGMTLTAYIASEICHRTFLWLSVGQCCK